MGGGVPSEACAVLLPLHSHAREPEEPAYLFICLSNITIIMHFTHFTHKWEPLQCLSTQYFETYKFFKIKSASNNS